MPLTEDKIEWFKTLRSLIGASGYAAAEMGWAMEEFVSPPAPG